MCLYDPRKNKYNNNESFSYCESLELRCESKENVIRRVSMNQKKMLPKSRKNVEMKRTSLLWKIDSFTDTSAFLSAWCKIFFVLFAFFRALIESEIYFLSNFTRIFLNP